MVFPVFALARDLLSDDILHLIKEKLGLQIELQGSDVVVTSPTESGYDAWPYAEIFAQNYNAIVGMENAGDMIALFHGTDSRPTGAFLKNIVLEHSARSVIDVCSGCMYDAIYFQGCAKRGGLSLDRFHCNEADDALRQQGERNIAEVRQTNEFPDLSPTTYYWQELGKHFAQGEFDASFCTGNSLSHIPERKQRIQSLANIAHVTKNVFVVDTRNYHWMLAHAGTLHADAVEMLSTQEYTGGNKQLFPGSVANFPVCIAKDSIIFAYVRDGQEQPYALVRFYPLSYSQLHSELSTVFGKVDVYLDGVKAENVSEEELSQIDAPRTIQFVCTEPNYEEAKKLM